MKKRMLAIIIAINVMLATAAVKGYVVATDPTAQTATAQSQYTVTVTQPRGTVYDCNMNRLTNTVTRSVAVLPPTVDAVTAVTSQLGASAEQVLGRLKAGKPVLSEVPMDFNCSSAAVFEVNDSLPADQLASHIIGYLNAQGDGVTGIQKAYNSHLKAEKPLKVTYTVDANGRPLSGLPAKVSGTAQLNSGVVLTLDSQIQRIVEAQGETLKKGAVVVMESLTGKIKGMASFPDYSPDSVAECLKSYDAPLLNRALVAYNVGSVFKLCVAAAALRSGMKTDTCYECIGYKTIGTKRFNCNNLNGHDMLDMSGGLAKSCNGYFIELGRSVGASDLYDTCLRFGFNRAYSLADGLTAAAGILPKKTTLLEQPAALANLSFGQGDLMLTPLHIAAMVAAIDNGGMLATPTLVQGVIDKSGKQTTISPTSPRRVITAEVADELKLMMQQVITSGTGVAARPESGVAGGKTATAETGWVIDGRTVTQSWFAGYWQGYTAVIVCEDGTSGSADCAPVFKRICDMMSGF